LNWHWKRFKTALDEAWRGGWDGGLTKIDREIIAEISEEINESSTELDKKCAVVHHIESEGWGRIKTTEGNN